MRDAEDRTVLEVNSRFRTLAEARALLNVAQMAQETAREKLRVKTNQYQVQAALLPDVLQLRAEAGRRRRPLPAGAAGVLDGEGGLRTRGGRGSDPMKTSTGGMSPCWPARACRAAARKPQAREAKPARPVKAADGCAGAAARGRPLLGDHRAVRAGAARVQGIGLRRRSAAAQRRRRPAARRAARRSRDARHGARARARDRLPRAREPGPGQARRRRGGADQGAPRPGTRQDAVRRRQPDEAGSRRRAGGVRRGAGAGAPRRKPTSSWPLSALARLRARRAGERHHPRAASRGRDAGRAGTVGFVLGDVQLGQGALRHPRRHDPVGAASATPSTSPSKPSPATAFAGRVTAIAPAADPQSRVFDVEVTIPNGDGRLRPGMIGTVAIGRTRRPASRRRPAGRSPCR